MSVLDSILNAMDKPPVNTERIRLKKVNDAMMRQQIKEKEKLKLFKEDIEKKINDFSNDEKQKKIAFSPMGKLQRTIVHEVASDAGMLTYSFGEEGIDRYPMVYKKEYMPDDDELSALRRGEEWTEEKAKQLLEQRNRKQIEYEKVSVEENFVPPTNYKEKYQHLIGLEAAKDAAKKTETNKLYGFVPSENKRDSRSIEQTLADIQTKKKLKKSTDHLS